MNMSLLVRKFFHSAFGLVCALALALSLFGCSWLSADDTDDDPAISPDNGIAYWIYPNDGAVNDSISANLAHGVRVFVHPNANYELSFDKDPNYSAPKLQLFRLTFNEDSTRYNARRVRSLKPTEEGDRYVYSFTCEENKRAIWAATLVDGRDYYEGTAKNVKLKGDGVYSDHFSINFIVVGKVKESSDGYSAEEIAQKLLENFRTYYSSVTIDTLYIRYASNHPTLGKKYPADEPWLAGRSSPDIFLGELGGWPETGLTNALDIVYVHRIEQENVLGYASLFSGNMGGGSESTVIIGNRVLDAGNKEVEITSDEIILSALHETGHFFGLRHTTSTSSDFNVSRDYSVYEDGLEDTPYCKNLLRGILYKSAGETEMVSDYAIPGPNIFKRISKSAVGSFPGKGSSVEDCPDASNYMFPAEVGVETLEFSEQQLEIIRKNLMIFPH